MDPIENAKRGIALMDLTRLGADDTMADIDHLIAKTVTTYGAVAAVCVWPKFAHHAVQSLAGTGVKVCAVADFPDGSGDKKRIGDAIDQIGEAGANEVDLVLPYRAFLAGEIALAEQAVAHARKLCGTSLKLKVILETGILQDAPAITDASKLALAMGADFLKTSTGMTAVSAKIPAARLMLAAIKDFGLNTQQPIGFKASGGIRDLARASLFLELADQVMGSEWVTRNHFRIGASALLDDLIRFLETHR